MSQSKRQKAIAQLCDPKKVYSIAESVEILKKAPKAKFDQTVEVSVKLGVDTKHADQQVRGTVMLPHGTGKTVRVAVVVEGEDQAKAKAAGADEVGAEDLMEKIQGGWLEFDVLVTVPQMMKQLSRLGKILGPKGLMPNPKTGTVTNNIEKAVQDMKTGKIEYRADKASGVHVPAGKISFTNTAIEENIQVIMQALVKARPSSAKGQYLRSAAVSTTMGPGVRLDLTQFKT